MLSLLDSAVFIGIFLIAVYILIPKTAKFWRLWKETEKTIHLSNAIASGVVAFSLLFANFILFLRAVWGFNV
jgi:hypothetical protein